MFGKSVLRCSKPVARSCASAAKSRRFASTFNWEDPLASQSLLSEEELAIQETARSYCQERMLPLVLGEQVLDQLCKGSGLTATASA